MYSQSDVEAVWRSDSTAPNRHQRNLQPGATTELTTKGLLLIVQKYVIVFKREMIAPALAEVTQCCQPQLLVD